jgi:hypothetical protein
LGRAADLARKAGALLVAAALIAAPANAAAACIDPNNIRAEYGSMPFTQTRHLNGITRPLVSRGQATIAAQRVDWHVTTPVDALTTITPSSITQAIDGGAPQRVNAGGDALLGSTGLFDMLTGNFDALQQHYTITPRPARPNGDWSIRLTPRAAGMARALTHIDVAGCERVAEVQVQQANGDRMEINLGPISR